MKTPFFLQKIMKWKSGREKGKKQKAEGSMAGCWLPYPLSSGL